MSGPLFYKKRNKTKRITIALTMITVIFASISAFIFFEREKPSLTLTPPISLLGNNTKLTMNVADQKSGIKTVKVTLRQGHLEKVYLLSQSSRKGYGFNVGPARESKTVEISLEGTGFKDGSAQLILEAEDFSFAGKFKGNKAKLQTDVTIDTTPPVITVLHAAQYIRPGGTGLVVYKSSDFTAEHGVQLNNEIFRGFRIDEENEDLFVAYVALNHDAARIAKAEVFAIDPAGNVTKKIISPTLKKARTKQDRINVGDTFLQAKLPEIEALYPEIQGNLLEKYLYVNETIRKQNDAIIKKICKNPRESKLWEGRFRRMAGSTRAQFADHRTYYYKNKAVDKQTHLGVDLASIKKADVKAANTGEVVFADYLGIYGNMIILDHGQGVFSLYSHLSQIDAAVGDIFSKGERMGSTGSTGMSGGDHLHFSMLVNGVFVNPVEWWDSRWVSFHLERVVDTATSQD